MQERTQHKLAYWWNRYKKQVLIASGVLVLIVVVLQLAYPSDRLLPYVSVDGQDIGNWQKKDAVWVLDKKYAAQPVNIYIGKNDAALLSPKPSEIGLAVSNKERIESSQYPWYMRLLPTSLLWYGMVAKPSKTLKVTHNHETAKTYVNKKLGKACDVKPVNATLKPKGDNVAVVPSQEGGTCEPEEVVSLLQKVAPTSLQPQQVRVPVDPIKPTITDENAKEVAEVINKQIAGGVIIKVGNDSAKFSAKTIANWLAVSVEKKKLQVGISVKKSKSKLQKELGDKVYLAPGITKVTTKDFTEVSRSNGKKGQQLDIEQTAENLANYIQGKSNEATGVVTTLKPEVHYTRTYSKSNTGISALMEHYAEDHKGTYGVQMIEIGGNGRRAGYNESKQFTTASTYKLFVAYSTLKKVEAGKMKWSQQINGGRDLKTCFDDMIVKSDNACAEALIEKISHETLQKDVNSLGLTSTTFSHATMNGSNYATTAGDLATFLAALETGSMSLKSDSRNMLLSAMKRNIYRQGIPAGVGATVANKVGFLADILNDASIVYSSKGTYALAITTEGSSWENIAELTREIEKLR